MKKAFTLVELLVVIAIIALLMAILMPSLQAARAQAQRVVCLSHLGQLGLGWFSYTQDNDGMIMYGCVASSYRDNKLGITYTGWVTGTSSEKGIKDGALYKYVPNVKLYACPARRNKAACLTYSIVDSMNGHRGFTWETEMPPYVSLLKVKNPARRFVFADEDAMLNGNIWTTTGESYTINYKSENWWDKPSGKHLGGMNFSFADGHSEYLKWDDKRTKELAKIKDFTTWNSTTLPGNGNQDLYHLQVCCWGKLGYDNPQEKPIW